MHIEAVCLMEVLQHQDMLLISCSSWHRRPLHEYQEVLGASGVSSVHLHAQNEAWQTMRPMADT